MDRESILRFSEDKGFGETSWITCPVCWNAMKVTVWEFAPSEEDCPACRRKERLMADRDGRRHKNRVDRD